MSVHNSYEICWKNYRAFKDTGWIELRPLTIIIGPNNSGKSSIISPLLLMHQTVTSKDPETPIITRGPVIDLGMFKHNLHNQDVGAPLFFGLRYHTHEPTDDTRELGSYPPGAVQFTLASDKETQEVKLQRYELLDIFKRSLLSLDRTIKGQYKFGGYLREGMSHDEIAAIQGVLPENFIFDTASIQYQLMDIQRRSNEDKDRAVKSPEFTRNFQMLLRCLGVAETELRTIFNELSYIGPLRDRPLRYYEVEGEIPRVVGSHGQHMASIINHKIATMGRELDAWVKRFEFGSGLRRKGIGGDLFSLSFRSLVGRQFINIADAGFGASQVLPLIVQALTAERDSLVVAEQPEIHLNPRLQTVLADLFVEMTERDQRVIVETHSEHLLLRVRTLIAKKAIKADDVALYFVERPDGESRIRRIEIQSNGHIGSEAWPKGFFADTLKESLALSAEQQKSS